jgi:hypothetical protein
MSIYMYTGAVTQIQYYNTLVTPIHQYHIGYASMSKSISVW